MAVDAIVSGVLKQLSSSMAQEIQQEVRLLVGVEKEVNKLKDNLLAIQAVLVDAEQRQVKEKKVKVWLDELKDASYDIDDVLDEWNTAMLKVQIEGIENPVVPLIAFIEKVCFCFPSDCFYFKQVGLRHDIALKIKEMNENLDVIAKRRDMFHLNVIKNDETKLADHQVPSTSLVDVEEICGRVEDKSTLVKKLCENNEKRLHIISLVGMGGIGKTTLAQFAYNDSEVMSKFNKRIWVCVSDPFDERRIARAIIESLEGSSTNLVEFNSLIEKIHESIKEKKFLLVLDDVWTEDHNIWKPFHRCLKSGLHGSKILVTTRKETVARMMESVDIIPIKGLSEYECWSVFEQLAFFNWPQEERENVEEIGRKIVEKCKGLPLAVKTIGSLLRHKKTREKWQNILDNEMWKVEEFEEGIFPPLLLSYNDLPSSVKQCFSYCSIFPKDYRMKKDQLIKLWMAQGYLVLEEDKEMEIISQTYFDILASRSFFQEFEKDDDGNIEVCKMHDIVHDCAQYLRKNECYMIEVNGAESFTNSSFEKIRHLMLSLNNGASFPISVYSAKRLRSLLIDYDLVNSLPNDVLQILFGELTCLRALMLYSNDSNGDPKEIPKEIGKMIHLRYLKLCIERIEKLPDTLCELYNLQTLDITWCRELKELPQGMEKLKNLRHLINELTPSLSHMPIERLTWLRTLSEFNIKRGEGGENNKASTMECLKDLNNLRGHFCIRGLGNETNASDFKGIDVLKNKRNLLSLRLGFDKDEEEDGERINNNNNGDDELLLQELQLPPNLEKLWIFDYEGNTFPSNWVTSLSTLRKLQLSFCLNCKSLSPLGKLSSLQSLHITGMTSVKRVGNEFWGIEGDDTSSSIVLFPKLKSLEFGGMSECEEWDYEVTSNREEEENVTIMPSLASLTVDYCPKLKALPDHLLQSTTLKKLEINQCPILEERYRKEVGEDWPKISLISNIIFDRIYVQGGPR